jgi:hypothetical protein
MNEDNILTLGFSSFAIFITITVWFLAILGAIINSFRRYGGKIPFARSCSAVISAACHPPPDEPADAAYKPLKWGVVSISSDGIVHCSFSSLKVREVIDGELCMGKS